MASKDKQSTHRASDAPGEGHRATTRWAAIDIGSDTVHLLVADAGLADDGWQLHPVRRDAALMELGKDVEMHGAIRAKTRAELQKRVSRYVVAARKLEAQVLISATEACRSAANGQEVLGQLAEAVGEPVRLLSAAREAQLGFLAMRPSIMREGCQLVIDSGGASTEVTVTEGRERTASVSVPVGAASLAATLNNGKPGGLRRVLEGVAVGEKLTALPPTEPVQAWATGGSAHNLAGLEQAELGRESQLLTMRDLTKLYQRLSRQPIGRIAKRSGEDPRRIRLLAPGAVILGSILEHYRLPACTVLRAGMREGMIIAASEAGDTWWQDALAS